jgi:transposase
MRLGRIKEEELLSKGSLLATRRPGKKRALVAIAHTILVLVYRSLASGQQYQERGSVEVDETKRRRLIRHHVRRLGRLGIAVSSLRLAGPDDSTYQ